MERSATCACGSLQVVVGGDPEFVAACSCTACQRRTGSVFGTMAYFREANVRVQGQSKVYQRSSDAGRKVCSHFCESCGTTLWIQGEFLPKMLGVAVGCFADSSFPVPGFATWVENRHGWVNFPETCQQSEKQNF